MKHIVWLCFIFVLVVPMWGSAQVMSSSSAYYFRNISFPTTTYVGVTTTIRGVLVDNNANPDARNIIYISPGDSIYPAGLRSTSSPYTPFSFDFTYNHIGTYSVVISAQKFAPSSRFPIGSTAASGTITVAPAPVQLTVVSPNGSEQWYTGLSYPIQWDAISMPRNGAITITLERDRGVRTELFRSIPNTGSILWTPLRNTPPGNYRIKIACVVAGTTRGCSSVSGNMDLSDSLFTIEKGVEVCLPAERKGDAGISSSTNIISGKNLPCVTQMAVPTSTIVNATSTWVLSLFDAGGLSSVTVTGNDASPFRFTYPVSGPKAVIRFDYTYRTIGTSSLVFEIADKKGGVIQKTIPVIVQSNPRYRDVVVIENIQSPISQQIGNYYVQSRGVDPKRIALVDVPTAEEINGSTFQMLRSQVENFLINNNFSTTTNYLITTKGVPLRVVHQKEAWPNPFIASVESELALILGPNEMQIGSPWWVYSNYFGRDAHFSRKAYGMYLVTRLDGYTFDQVKAMIDKTVSPIPLSSSAQFVLDEDPAWPWSYAYLNNAMDRASALLNQIGFKNTLDATPAFLTGQQNVIGYAGWGSNDHAAVDHAKPHNGWLPGAIAETYVSSGARTFNAPAVYGQSLIADLIEEGVSGVKGYVYEPYAGAMAQVDVLFDRYTRGYNLAESFAMASPYVSWMDVVVGDPKATIVVSYPTPGVADKAKAFRRSRDELLKTIPKNATDTVPISTSSLPGGLGLQDSPIPVAEDSKKMQAEMSAVVSDAGTTSGYWPWIASAWKEGVQNFFSSFIRFGME